jgi:hypothetical protein
MKDMAVLLEAVAILIVGIGVGGLLLMLGSAAGRLVDTVRPGAPR